MSHGFFVTVLEQELDGLFHFGRCSISLKMRRAQEY